MVPKAGALMKFVALQLAGAFIGLGRRLGAVVSSWLAGAFIGLGRRLGLLLARG